MDLPDLLKSSGGLAGLQSALSKKNAEPQSGGLGDLLGIAKKFF